MVKKFSASVRRILAERAGQRCGNPNCGRPTGGPSHDGSGRSTNHGRACHISAASPTGPRYDSTLTEEQRFHPDNGIWLCANCGDRVDKHENLEEFPVELLRNWKAFHESVTGTDHASLENRRIYPLRKLTVDDFAGVRGEASITFGALTIILGACKLSHSIGDLLRIFSERKDFERTRQPTSEAASDFGRIPLTDKVAWAITVTRTRPRPFASRGRLKLQQSDGREFIVTTQETGATFSVGDLPIPRFSPTITTVAVGKTSESNVFSGRQRSGPESDEENLATYFDMSLLELKSSVDGIPKDTSVFGYDYRFDSTGSLLVRRGIAGEYQTVNSLSGGEHSRLILDLATRVATYSARISPTALLIDQANVLMDPRGWACLFEWVEKKKPPFQTIVDLWCAPSEGDLTRALCYETRGDDMEVSSFELKTWRSFKRSQKVGT